jgi:hypothetical protein
MIARPLEEPRTARPGAGGVRRRGPAAPVELSLCPLAIGLCF